MTETVLEWFDESARLLAASRDTLAEPLVRAAELIAASYRQGGGVMLFGNGGSACDAQHIACELVGRFEKAGRSLRAQALTCDGAILTAVSNDYDYESIFARQVEGAGRAGDVAIGLSTSGNSPNVLAGLAKARDLGLKTIAMTGSGGGACADVADVLIAVPGQRTAHVQEVHMVAYHALCKLVEDAVRS